MYSTPGTQAPQMMPTQCPMQRKGPILRARAIIEATMEIAIVEETMEITVEETMEITDEKITKRIHSITQNSSQSP
jgi:hypothetical protein